MSTSTSMSLSVSVSVSMDTDTDRDMDVDMGRWTRTRTGTWKWTRTWADPDVFWHFSHSTFFATSRSVFSHSTFCPVRRFFHSAFLTIRPFVPFDVFSIRRFVPFGIFSIRHFVPFGVLSFDVLSFDVLYFRRLLLRHFVGKPSQGMWPNQITVTKMIFAWGCWLKPFVLAQKTGKKEKCATSTSVRYTIMVSRRSPKGRTIFGYKMAFSKWGTPSGPATRVGMGLKVEIFG